MSAPPAHPRDSDDTREGVIQFDLRYRECALHEALHAAGTAGDRAVAQHLRLLCRWHRQLRRRQWLGQQPDRYHGLAYGNLSVRDAGGPGFVISGTQTGGVDLTRHHLCRVLSYCVERNRIEAAGPVKPSSEALTHAAGYALSLKVQWIFHIHSPVIWERAAAAGLPVSDPEVPYGTPAMALELARLHRAGALTRGVLAMGGHRDGVISLAATARGAASQLLRAFDQCRALRPG